MTEQQNAETIKKLMAAEGDYKSFTYRDIECEIIRIKSLGHLCGYLKIDITRDDIEYAICESQFHGGVTYHQDKIGFDCAQFGDMTPGFLERYSNISSHLYGTYRTMKYVEDILKETIDRIIEYRNEAADE